jgi:hypothetical protein
LSLLLPNQPETVSAVELYASFKVEQPAKLTVTKTIEKKIFETDRITPSLKKKARNLRA